MFHEILLAIIVHLSKRMHPSPGNAVLRSILYTIAKKWVMCSMIG